MEFWQKGLSDPEVVKPVKDGECLRLFLTTADEFRYFRDAVKSKLLNVNWLDGPPEGETDEDDVLDDQEATV